MKLLAKQLKPYVLVLLLCLVLLFGQAMCDLSLPNFMSEMVNVGIQQGGIEEGAPKAMSKNAMDLLTPFFTAEEKTAMEEGYITVEPGSSESQRISEEYPLAREEAVCVKKADLTEELSQQIDAAYAHSTYAMMLYLQQAGESGELEQLAMEAAAAQQGGGVQMNGSAYPETVPGGETVPGMDMGEMPESRMPGEEDPGYNLAVPSQGEDNRIPDGAAFNLPEDTAAAGSGENSVSSGSGAQTRIGTEEYPYEANTTEEFLPADEVPYQGDLAGGESFLDVNSDIASSYPLKGPEDTDSAYAEPYGENGQIYDENGQPTQENGGDMVSSSPYAAEDGENPTYPSGTEQGYTSTQESFSFEDGLGEDNLHQLYDLIPLLQLAPSESISQAQQTASAGDSMMAGQVGISLTRMFYTELGVDVDKIRSDYIFATGAKMLGITLLGVVATVLVGFFAAQVAARVAKRLRHQLFEKVMQFSNGEFDKFSTASLITRTTNDVQQVQMLITMGVRMVCYAPIMGIGGIIFAVGKSVSMSWIIAVAVLVMLGLILVALSLALPKFKALQKLIDRLNLVSRENLSGMMVVRAFGNEDYEEKRFDTANTHLADTTRFVQRVMSAMMPSMMLIMNLVSVVIIWVGGHAIADSTLQIGDMMAFIQYAMQIISAFLMIAVMFVMVPRASVSAVRIQEVLDMPLSITDKPETKLPEQVTGELEFKDVSFRYGNAESDVLEHISFTAKPGETTAFIGATGSGKSTLLHLIPRFYDVTEGEILLDGVDIRDMPQKELREKIAFVPQKGVLFSGTIDSNIRYGKEETQPQEIQDALDVAQATEFVSQLEEGVESPISQGGTNVSGGQRQRLAIARALVRKAPVYLFDDSFSALDFKTDAALRKALKTYTAQSTVLIVAQRVSTIMHAQQIIVLDGGKMVGKGTHQELLANCPAYREIAESQLQKEELE